MNKKLPSPPWHSLAKASDLEIDPTGLHVRFADSRSHRLRVIEEEDAWLLRGLIVRQVSGPFEERPALEAALRNRHLRLIGLRIVGEGRLIGECRVPKPGLTAGEFQLHARHLAAECDRLEYLLTGKDREAR